MDIMMHPAPFGTQHAPSQTDGFQLLATKRGSPGPLDGNDDLAPTTGQTLNKNRTYVLRSS